MFEVLPYLKHTKQEYKVVDLVGPYPKVSYL